MASTPYISHVINGYSRYDVPQNIAFTASPGLLYVGRCDFLNPKDTTYIQTGCVIRSEPTTVPSFTPYQVRLHRFFVPMQLYHPEMRTNSSGFNFEDLSVNVFPTSYSGQADPNNYYKPESLFVQLGLMVGMQPLVKPSLPSTNPTAPEYFSYGTNISLGAEFVNADPFIGYWDIVRNYYGFSQTNHFSIASTEPLVLPKYGTSEGQPVFEEIPSITEARLGLVSATPKWHQYFCYLDMLDAYYNTKFYPRTGFSQFIDRTDLLLAVINCAKGSVNWKGIGANLRDAQKLDIQYIASSSNITKYANCLGDFLLSNCPLAVIPSMPDRFSRALPASAGRDVSIASLTTVRQLAVAARLQEYQDLLSAGGSRFTDWLKTYFGASVSHVDRPLLLYSKSLFMSSSPVFNNAGEPGNGLGAYGGQLSCMEAFDKKPIRYCFDEPGYLMDLVSIRPLYYYARPIADYAFYQGLDYFNPLFNEVGYQTIHPYMFGLPSNYTYSGDTLNAYLKEPCYNEFRASYDYVFGDFMMIPNSEGQGGDAVDNSDLIRTAWVIQRTPGTFEPTNQSAAAYSMALRFVDLGTANAPFSSAAVDNFFINLYYNVSKKSLVSKQFATRLASR